MQNKSYSNADLLSMPPDQLLDYLTNTFIVHIPLAIETPNDVKIYSEEMAKASSYYSYLTPLKLQANMQKRFLKRQGASKEDIEDMLVRESIFESQLSVMKQTYDTISRLFTVRHREQDELKMMGGSV